MTEKKNIVFLVSRIPYPLEKGDKLRTFYQLKELSKFFNVHLICLNDNEFEAKSKNELTQYCTSITIYELKKYKIYFRLLIALFRSKPYQIYYFHDISIHKKINQQIKLLNPFHIYCQLIRTSEYVKANFICKKTIDYMDAFSQGMFRRSEKENFILKFFTASEAKRLQKYESLIFDYFDNHTIISEQDRNYILHPKRNEIKIVKNGVSIEPSGNLMPDKKYDILFHGNLGYSPNIDCVKYIVDEILPLLTIKKPTIKVAISGANSSQKIKTYCDKFPNNIIQLGFVEDIYYTYKSAKLFFAPMQIGSGLQNKILEAMACEIAVITSRLCNNAIGATHKKDIYSCKNVEEYISSIIELLENEALRNSIASNGKTFVEQNYSWNKCTLPLVDCINN